MPDPHLEVFHIEQFLEFSGIAVEQPPVYREAPDCVLRTQGKLVGVEHTQFFLPPPAGEIPHQQIQKLQELAVAHARKCFRDAGGPALYVYPLVDDRRGPLDKRQAYALGEKLADEIMRRGWPEDRETRSYEVWREVPAVHSVTITPSVDGVDELWHPGGGGWVATVERDAVQGCIGKKAMLYDSYAPDADEVWLLIVNDIFRGGAPCEIGEEATAAAYDTPFERVFWLELGRNTVVELLRRPNNGLQATDPRA